MRFHADLHIHSKYSRACSKDCDLEHLTWWARRKGIAVVGTGDFTHPAWHEHLRDSLVPAEPGLFRLRDDLDAGISRRLPPNIAERDVRFMLSVEISTIYKRGEHTRKIHHLVYMPDFDSAAEFNRRLGRIGNLGSDGRPILGLDSRDLLEITLESGDGAYLVPAHLWTPWFAVLGSKSGFDAVEDCYLDLADHVFAVETGLSSDPAMNRRVSRLDGYRMVSNSDAHSPPMLGRETTVFDVDMDYFAIRRAMETGDGHEGSVEFFPEEGKYHEDGHRKCEVRMTPSETREHGGMCPQCGKPVTVGVLNRVEELADRPEGYRLEGAADFRCLVPLPEIVSEIAGTGPKSKKVLTQIDGLVAALGPELSILQDVPLEDITAQSTLLGEAVARLRRGEVIREAGYDGEYGVIRLFEPGEVTRLSMVDAPGLFDESALGVQRARAKPAKAKPRPTPAAKPPTPHRQRPQQRVPSADGSLLDGLDPDQRAAAEVEGGPLLIIAGPGTGKTRTLTHRIAHQVTARGVAPERCLAITFTRRAAEEMTERLAALTPDHASKLTVATFHSLGAALLREHHERAGLSPRFGVADTVQQLEVAVAVVGDEKEARRLLAERSRPSSKPDDVELIERYVAELRRRDLVDFDDLVAVPTSLLESDPGLAAEYRDRWHWTCVDEYQDVDEQQYRLLRQLAPADGNLTAIGDPDQAIYRFRGADVGFFLRFQQDFPSARTVQLTRNYRCGAKILTAARQVIAPTSLVADRVLTPVGAHGEVPVGIHHAATEQAEASFVARMIDQLLGGSSFHSLDSGRVDSDDTHGLGFADFAVLYRTDRQARAVMAAMTRSGVPFQKRSHDRLADRPGVEPILAELALASTDAAAASVADRLRRAAEVVAGRLTTGEPEEAAAVHSAVDLLTPLATRCGDDLERFHTELMLGAEVDLWDPRADRVSLLTLHASKGLEFPVVFVVGCEDGLVPLRWPGTSPETGDDEHVREERRLLFVGMTRAQQRLYLSHAAQRPRQGATAQPTRSPFLAEIDATVSEPCGDTVSRRRTKAFQPRLL